MLNEFSHMEALIGETGTRRLASAKVAIFGLGGEGSFAAEALARCGVGSLTLVDPAMVTVTNLNRQIHALHSTLGQSKAQAAKMRIRDINEDILVHAYETCYNLDTEALFDLGSYDYIIDAMDTVPSKLLLIGKAQKSGTPVISSLGTSGKIAPEDLRIADISRARTNPIARYIMKELKIRKLQKVKILYVKEKNRRKNEIRLGGVNKAASGSISFMSGTAGLLAAGVVVRDLLEEKKDRKEHL